jgi:hypothetical protein
METSNTTSVLVHTNNSYNSQVVPLKLTIAKTAEHVRVSDIGQALCGVFPNRTFKLLFGENEPFTGLINREVGEEDSLPFVNGHVLVWLTEIGSPALEITSFGKLVDKMDKIVEKLEKTVDKLEKSKLS